MRRCGKIHFIRMCVMVLLVSLQRDRQRWDTQSSPFQGRTNRARNGHTAADIFTIIYPGDNQVRFLSVPVNPRKDFQHRVQHSLSGSTADSVYLPGLSMDLHLLLVDDAV